MFEEQARTWLRRFASDSTLAVRDHIGPSHVSINFGIRALDAKLLLFAAVFDPELVNVARRRSDVELIDLDRLHRGS